MGLDRDKLEPFKGNYIGIGEEMESNIFTHPRAPAVVPGSSNRSIMIALSPPRHAFGRALLHARHHDVRPRSRCLALERLLCLRRLRHDTLMASGTCLAALASSTQHVKTNVQVLGGLASRESSPTPTFTLATVIV